MHERAVVGRRARVLSTLVSEVLPVGGRVIDVGTGDGTLAALVGKRLPGITLTGLDVLARTETAVPVQLFNGLEIPFVDDAFDAVMLIDVLHHAADPHRLLRESARVAPIVVVKDHLSDGFLAEPILRFMDRVGNARHGVSLRYVYWKRAEWVDALRDAKLREVALVTRIPLYPVPASWIFGRDLHFIARLERL